MLDNVTAQSVSVVNGGEEALHKHCTPSPPPPRRGANGRERGERGTGAVAGDESRDLRECNVDLPFPHSTSSPNLICQGPEDPAVPPQLLLMLKLNTFNEKMKRAEGVELHDPAGCCVSAGFSGLGKFYQEEEDTTAVPSTEGQTEHTLWRVCTLGEFGRNLPKPFDAHHWIWEEQLGLCGSQQPRVALATAKER